jgi:hypothetical protein
MKRGGLMADEVDIRKRLMTLAQRPMAQGSGGSNIEISEAELRGLRQLPGHCCRRAKYDSAPRF